MPRQYFPPVAILTLALSAAAIIFSIGQIEYRQDFVGHLFKAQQQPLSHYLQGWNLTYWAGYSEDIYPNGYHYLLKLFLTQLPEHQAVQALTWILVVAQVVCLYFLAKTWTKHPRQAPLTLSILLIMLTIIPGSMLGGFISSFLAGSGPATLGFILFSLTLIRLHHLPTSVSSMLQLGIIIGLSLLTHTLSAVVITIVTLTYTLFSPNHRVRLFESLLLGIVIGLPWLWIFINPNFSGSRINFPGNPTWALIPLGISLIFVSKSYRHLPPLAPVTILLLTASAINAPLSDWLAGQGIAGFHWYRFFPYGATLLILLISSHIPKLFSPTSPWINLTIVQLLLAQQLFTTTQTIIQIHLPHRLGRILDLTTHLQTFNVPRTASYLITHNQTTAADNMFYESSPMGILFYTLEKQISPNGYTGGIDARILLGQAKIPTYQLKPQQAADVLGISDFLISTPAPLQDAQATPAGIAIYSTFEKFSLPTFLYTKSASKRPLLESLNYLPQLSQTSFVTWWPQASLDNLFRMPADFDQDFDGFLLKNQLDLSAPPVQSISFTKNSISYQIAPTAANAYVPVFMKFNYHPSFTATADGLKVPIAKVSPNYMLVPSKGNVVVNWSFPPILLIIEKFSLTALGISTTIAAITYRNSRYQVT